MTHKEQFINSPTSTEEEKGAARQKTHSFAKRLNDIQMKIYAKLIPFMEKVPVTTVWIDKLHELSLIIKNNPNSPFKEKVEFFYSKLSEEQKAAEKGMDITANIFR